MTLTSHTDLETLRKELLEARVTLQLEREWRERAEKQLSEANQEIGRLRAQLAAKKR